MNKNSIFARREFEKVKDANQSITWENSCMLQSLTIDRIFDLFVLASILKTIFGIYQKQN